MASLIPLHGVSDVAILAWSMLNGVVRSAENRINNVGNKCFVGEVPKQSYLV